MSTLMETRVAGIPCTARIIYVSVVEGNYSYNAASDLDYYGYAEVDWELCDRRGRPAPWLAKKLTPADTARIENEILGYSSTK